MRRIFLICGIGFTFFSFGQFDVGFHLGGGAGYIANSATVNLNHLDYGSPFRSYPRRSFEGGTTMLYSFEQTSISFGVNYFQINAYQIENTEGFSDNGFSGELIFVEKERKIGYLALPILFHRDYNKLSFGGGLQSQFVLHVKEMKKTWTGYGNEPSNAEAVEDNRTINAFDIGLVGQVNAKATNRLSLNFKVYWGLYNLNNYEEKGAYYEFYGVENPVVDRKLKNRQFIITAQYNLFGK